MAFRMGSATFARYHRCTILNLDKDLAHVFWIGGSACAGKSSVVHELAERYSLDVYHCDEHFETHRQRADPRRHPGFCRLMDRLPEELWARPVEKRVRELERFYEDELDMVIEDLLAEPAQRPVLVEGAGLLPARITEVLHRPHRAVWLVASGEFRRRHYPSRDSRIRKLLDRCRNPREAYRSWMKRDDHFAESIAAAARRVGGRVVEVDGTLTLAETAAAVARYLHLETEKTP